MPVTRGDFSALMASTARALNSLWMSAENQMEEEQWKRYFNVLPSDKMFETDLGLVGMNGPTLKGELETMERDSPRMGRGTIYLHNNYALASEFSQEALEDDQSGQLARIVIPEMRSGFAYEKELQAAKFFALGFQVNGWEPEISPARPLFSNDHKLIRGMGNINSASNLLAGAAISSTTLNAVRILGRKTRSESGKLAQQKFTRLIVPPSQQALAEEVIKSPLKPGQFPGGTQPNDVNIYEGSMRIEVWDFLEQYSTTAWFVSVDKDKTRFKHFNRKDLTTRKDYDEDAQAFIFRASARWSFGFSDWRGVAGSQGA